MTARQCACWQVFLAEEEARPTRDNYYQMQTAMRIDMVGNMFRKHPSAVFRLEDYRLNRSGTTTPADETPEQATERLMQRRPHHLKRWREARGRG